MMFWRQIGFVFRSAFWPQSDVSVSLWWDVGVSVSDRCQIGVLVSE